MSSVNYIIPLCLLAGVMCIRFENNGLDIVMYDDYDNYVSYIEFDTNNTSIEFDITFFNEWNLNNIKMYRTDEINEKFGLKTFQKINLKTIEAFRHRYEITTQIDDLCEMEKVKLDTYIYMRKGLNIIPYKVTIGIFIVGNVVNNECILYVTEFYNIRYDH